MFVVVVNFRITPEHVAEFAIAVQKQARNSLTLEDDCHVFDVCAADNEFLLYEKYTDVAAFDCHLASEHFKQFDAQVSAWFDRKTVSQWQEMGVSE